MGPTPMTRRFWQITSTGHERTQPRSPNCVADELTSRGSVTDSIGPGALDSQCMPKVARPALGFQRRLAHNTVE